MTNTLVSQFIRFTWGDYSGSPLVKTRHFHCRVTGSGPGWRTKILHAPMHSYPKKKKKKNSIMFTWEQNPHN